MNCLVSKQGLSAQTKCQSSQAIVPSSGRVAPGVAATPFPLCRLAGASRSSRIYAEEGDSATASAPESEGATPAPATGEAPASAESADWVPVLKTEDLPKGTRKEVNLGQKSVLLFWYRNEVYAIESRSPAEGAYSEGFLKAKFTQDFCIECPTTGSLFSLKDGSIQSWYPNNKVLAMLTPQDTCRPLTIYPVQVGEEVISIDAATVGDSATTKGGMGTSLENNNVFGLEPKMYVDGSDPTRESSGMLARSGVDTASAATVLVGLAAAGIVGVAGTATALYYEDYVLLGGFWLVLLVAVAFLTKPFFDKGDETPAP